LFIDDKSVDRDKIYKAVYITS